MLFKHFDLLLKYTCKLISLNQPTVFMVRIFFTLKNNSQCYNVFFNKHFYNYFINKYRYINIVHGEKIHLFVQGTRFMFYNRRRQKSIIQTSRFHEIFYYFCQLLLDYYPQIKKKKKHLFYFGLISMIKINSNSATKSLISLKPEKRYNLLVLIILLLM